MYVTIPSKPNAAMCEGLIEKAKEMLGLELTHYQAATLFGAGLAGFADATTGMADAVPDAPATPRAPKPSATMIEAGAKALVSWDDGCVWPKSWSPLVIAGAKRDAARVWQAMWLNAAEQLSGPASGPAVAWLGLYPDGCYALESDFSELSEDLLWAQPLTFVAWAVQHALTPAAPARNEGLVAKLDKAYIQLQKHAHLGRQIKPGEFLLKSIT